MTWLSPLHLAAAAGVAVPILIHLFGRPRPRHVRFPSLRLLRVAHRERHSSVRLQRLVSLLLRCLALLLLAAALALPTARTGWLAALGRPLGATAVLVDVSASMRMRTADRTGMARAREAAREIMAGLPYASPVVLAGAGASLRAVAEGPLSAGQAAGLTAGLRATDEHARLRECLASALGERAGGGGSAVLITDGQATSLGASPAARLPRGAGLIVVDVGAPAGENLAITDASVHDRPAVRGRPLSVDAQVRAFGNAGDRVPVTLMYNKRAEDAATATLRPDGLLSVRLGFTPRTAGVVGAQVRIPEDGFALDDRRLVASIVRERLRVVVVGDEEGTRFIRTALDPFPPGDERSTIEVTRVDPVALSDADLERADAIVLAESAGLSPDALAATSDAARRGVGVLVYVGPDAPEAGVLAALGLGGVEVGDAVTHRDGLALAEFASRRPPLDAFAESGAGDLSVARFTTTCSVAVEEASATALARFDDGAPAMVEASLGRGTVLLLATAPDDAWTDLPRLPVYVPLMHTLVHYLAAGSSPTTLDAFPGEMAAGRLPPDAAAPEAIGPDGEAVAVERVGDAWRFTPDRIGTWRVTSGEEDICAFAVNLDPAESDLTRVADAELRSTLQPMDVTVVAADDLSRMRGALARPVDISALFALLALVTLAADAAVVHRGAGSAGQDG